MAEKSMECFRSDEVVPLVPTSINVIASSWSHHEIVEEDEDDDFRSGNRLTPEISEECKDDNVSDLFYNDRKVRDVVYVVISTATEERSSASMDALVWTLGSSLCRSSNVCLVHVVPELRLGYIPTLLGRLPTHEANAKQIESYVNQEQSKRSERLQKFISVCSSNKVQVETMLIETDMEAKAILDLIPVLNIRNLVIGTTKSSLRKLQSRSQKGDGKSLNYRPILENAPAFCAVRVICKGKEVFLQDHLTSLHT